MSPAHVLEPTYDAIRRRLIRGAWPPGQRLEAARIADELGVSITPVRDSLNRLTGERLVHSLAGEGFSVPRHTEADLRAMLDWHHLLVGVALDRQAAIAMPQVPPGHNGVADWTALLFATLGAALGSSEGGVALAGVAARLGPYRNAEHQLFADVEDELQKLEDSINGGDCESTRVAVADYHRRRRDHASQLVEVLRKSPL